MKAITIWQPWASLIVHGVKHYETRGWYTGYRGPIAIHAAAKKVTKKEWETFSEKLNMICGKQLPLHFRNGEIVYLNPKTKNETVLKRGCVLAVADIVDCIRIDKDFLARLTPLERALGDYSDGRCAWKLENITTVFESDFSISGQQRIWNLKYPFLTSSSVVIVPEHWEW